MDKDVAKNKFRSADQLFQDGEFALALEVLQRLQEEFPDERKVLYPLARSLAKLKRYDEAVPIAERLVLEFNYPPAQELLDGLRLRQQRQASGDLVGAGGLLDDPDDVGTLPSGLESIMNTPAALNAPPPLPQRATSGPDWFPLAFWIGLAIAGFALTVLITVTAGRPVFDWYAQLLQDPEKYNLNPELLPPFPLQSCLIILLSSFAGYYVFYIFSGYFALRILGALRYEDFNEDMKDVAVATLVGTLLSFVPILGWYGFLYYLNKRYELGFGKLVLTVLLWTAIGTAASIVISIAFWMIVSSIVGLSFG